MASYSSPKDLKTTQTENGLKHVAQHDLQPAEDDLDLPRAPSPSPSTDSRSTSSSRSPSPHLAPLPDPVASFFSSVSLGGFPKPAEKVQPWKRVWKGPQEPSPDGKLLVACPRICVYEHKILTVVPIYEQRDVSTSGYSCGVAFLGDIDSLQTLTSPRHGGALFAGSSTGDVSWDIKQSITGFDMGKANAVGFSIRR